MVLIHIFDSFVNAVSDVKTTPSTSSQTIWHRRLGHPNANVLRLVLHYCFFFIGKDKYYILKGSTRGTQSTKELQINGSTVKLEILKGNQSMDTKSNYMHK